MSGPVEKPKMYSDVGLASTQPQFIPATGTPSSSITSNASLAAGAGGFVALNPEIYPVVAALLVASAGAIVTYAIIDGLLSETRERRYDLPSPYTTRDNTNVQPRLVLAPPYLYSKGGNKNVWPDGQYEKPGPKKIDWKKGDQELADEITGSGAPKGPTTPNNLIKKWFRDKRPK